MSYVVLCLDVSELIARYSQPNVQLLCLVTVTYFASDSPTIYSFEILPRFQVYAKMSNEDSDDTISMDGRLYDLALGDGLTDNELADEMQKLSDHNVAPKTPKVASIIVIPEGTNQAVMNLELTSARLEASATKHMVHPPTKTNRNKSGSAKIKSAPSKEGPLPALFSKAALK